MIPDFCIVSANAGDFVVSVFILAGVAVSYAPQIYKIIKKRSSYGLNALTLAAASFANSAILMNAVLLQWDIFRCCAHQDSFVCAEKVMGIVIISTQTLITATMYGRTALCAVLR